MKKILVILLVLISITGFSQKPTDIMISPLYPLKEKTSGKTKQVNYEYLSKLIFKEINEYRKSKNLTELKWDNILAEDCNSWSYYLCENNEFRHPTYLEHDLFKTQFNVECLASIINTSETYLENAKHVVNRWKNSRPHNALLLSSEDGFYGKGDAICIGAVGLVTDDDTNFNVVFRIKAIRLNY